MGGRLGKGMKAAPRSPGRDPFALFLRRKIGWPHLGHDTSVYHNQSDPFPGASDFPSIFLNHLSIRQCALLHQVCWFLQRLGPPMRTVDD